MRIFIAAFAAHSLFCLAIIGLSAHANDMVENIADDIAESMDEPLWEAGLGGAAFSAPTYPGADDNTTQSLAVPYVIYRGDVWSIGDESGVRAVAFENDKIELDMSLGASLASNANEDADRIGMPDLDFLFEIGPQAIFHALQVEHDNWVSHVDIKLRTRAVIATDFGSFSDQGYIFEPALVYQLQSKHNRHLRFRIDLEVISGSERLNEYFYDVDTAYVTAERPYYQAEAGYIGTELGVGLSLPVNPGLRMFAGFDVEFYDGSANQDSPLFKEEIAYSGGVAMVYTFYESEERVNRR